MNLDWRLLDVRLIYQFLKRTITFGGNYWTAERGISLGCPLSPLMAALYLRPLDEAMAKLALEAPEKAELVKLRYFAGFSLAEAASSMGVSHATAKRYWAYARAWLYTELIGKGP